MLYQAGKLRTRSYVVNTSRIYDIFTFCISILDLDFSKVLMFLQRVSSELLKLKLNMKIPINILKCINVLLHLKHNTLFPFSHQFRVNLDAKVYKVSTSR